MELVAVMRESAGGSAADTTSRMCGCCRGITYKRGVNAGNAPRVDFWLWISTTEAVYADVSLKWFAWNADHSLLRSSIESSSGTIFTSSNWSARSAAASAWNAGGRMLPLTCKDGIAERESRIALR